MSQATNIRCMKDNTKPVGFTLAQISETLKKQSNNDFKKGNLTFSQTRFLDYLNNHQDEEKIKLKDIEDYFSIQHSTAVGIIQRLEQKNFISTIKDEKDNRCRLIKRTNEGIAIQKSIDANYEKMNKLFIKNMSKEEAKELQRLLEILLANLKDEK